MNHYVTLALTSRKSSVHLHALYSPRTALRMFTPRRDHLQVCLLYLLWFHLCSFVGLRFKWYTLYTINDVPLGANSNTPGTWTCEIHNCMKSRLDLEANTPNELRITLRSPHEMPRCTSAAAWIADSNPARRTDVCPLCLYVVLSCAGRGLCDGLITRPEESYRVSNSL
jgi:hypothetical protein